MSPKDGSVIAERKRDHIKIALGEDVEHRITTWLEYVVLPHYPLPELDFESVDTRCTFLKREFSAPILIEGMTGGTEEGKRINANLALAAEKYNLPMGVGSQRVAIVDPGVSDTFRVAREMGPHVFLMANIGAAQLIKGGVELAWKAVKMIEADALVIHLNPLQELIQPGGDTNFVGLMSRIKQVVRELAMPVIVKEVGCGLTYDVAMRLREIGVDAVDVAGAGGTNWTEIERVRAAEAGALEKVELAETFRDWGIPTAASVLEVASVEGMEVVGSGGIRDGLDVAKLLCLGAEMGGLARPFLKAAVEGEEAVELVVKKLVREIKAALFLTGSRSVKELANVKPVILGPLREWYLQRVANRIRPDARGY